MSRSKDIPTEKMAELKDFDWQNARLIPIPEAPSTPTVIGANKPPQCTGNCRAGGVEWQVCMSCGAEEERIYSKARP